VNLFINPNRAEIQLVLTVILLAYAWYRGGEPERASAGTMLAMLIVDRAYHVVFDASVTLSTTDIWHFTLDLGVLAAFGAIALQANRFYPLVLAGLQLVAVNAHLVRSFVEAISPIAYFGLYVVPSYFQLIVIAVGISLHARRYNRFGPYRDWRGSPVPA